MTSPADTTIYMLAGYLVIFGAIFIYVASLVLRFRRLHGEAARLNAEEEAQADNL